MSYRLTDVTDLPQSADALLMLVHPLSAVDIVSDTLSPYTSSSTPIENLDSSQPMDELLEQLRLGERVLFDVSGGSPGIFRSRRAAAETMVGGLPPRLTQALDTHWEGAGAAGGLGGAPVQNDSLAPAIEPTYQPSSPVSSSEPEPGLHTLELIYRWPDGSGVAGAAYVVDGLDSNRSGVLDNDGRALVTGLPDSVVDVRFGEPAKAGETDILRRQLQAQLDAVLARERREAARLDASTAELPLTINAGVHFAKGFMGLWDSAVGLVTTALAVGNLSPLAYYNRAVQSAWMATLDSSDQAWRAAFNREFDEANKRALVDALGFDPDAISREQLAEAYEITNLILEDEECREILGRFAIDFAQAQDSTEISYFAGGLVFEAVLAIILAAATGGPGAAVSAPRYLKKLAPLGDALRKLAARLKVAKQTRYHYSVATDGVCEGTCRPRSPATDLKPRTLASRRLQVNSIAEARTALAASRKRIIARGGYTPKYTQEELLELAQGGLDEDRFIVRLVEQHHVDGYQQPPGAMAGTLGRKDAAGSVRFWSTTLDQVEASDTCPRLIAAQMGVEYQPKATYKLAIIDRQKALELSDAETMIPTFENLTGYINTKLANKPGNPEMVKQVMTPEYQAKYEKLVEGMGDAEWKSFKERVRYLIKQGLDESDIDVFEVRLKVQNEIGANQYFLGNGLTKHTSLSSKDRTIHGALETYTVEKNPQTFYTMTNGGQGGPEAYVDIIDLVPIDFGDGS